MIKLEDYIYAVPDFPIEGILFRDITPLLQDGEAFSYAIKLLTDYAKSKGATVIAGPESRGFIFATPVASSLQVGFVPVRKPGKLPREAVEAEYALEYGTNTLCMHKDAIKKGDKVVLIDDLLATGGTLNAAIDLVHKLGGEVVGIACLIELEALKGREVLKGYDVYCPIKY